MKKLLAMATSLALLATSAIVPMTAAAAEEKEVTKPEKITIMLTPRWSIRRTAATLLKHAGKN